MRRRAKESPEARSCSCSSFWPELPGRRGRDVRAGGGGDGDDGRCSCAAPEARVRTSRRSSAAPPSPSRPGARGYDSWRPAVARLCREEVPLVYTSYNAADGRTTTPTHGNLARQLELIRDRGSWQSGQVPPDWPGATHVIQALGLTDAVVVDTVRQFELNSASSIRSISA